MGSRYGVTIRKNEAKVLESQRAKHTCPKCGKTNVKRTGNSIWQCRSCKAKFTGGAYAPATGPGDAVVKFLKGLLNQ